MTKTLGIVGMVGTGRWSLKLEDPSTPIMLHIWALSFLIVGLLGLLLGNVAMAGGFVTAAVVLVFLSLYSLTSEQRRQRKRIVKG
jgi:hypothetical protein